MIADLYRIQGPSVWAGPPETFSHSSLTAIESCARRWQLARSTYEGLGRFPEKPNRAAIAGDLVHRLIDELFKALGLAGCPPLGSPDFAAVVARFGLRARASSLLEEKRKSWRDHPRTGARVLDLGVESIANQVVQLFRREYSGAPPSKKAPPRSSSLPSEPSVGLVASLDHLGALTELALTHPTIPFTGTIDLVRRDHDGAVVVDFKTGAHKPEHETQVLLYALLWWRNTDEIPSRAEVRYPRDAVTCVPNRKGLAALERTLRQRIDMARQGLGETPAPASVGDHCRFCSHRAFCDEVWSAAPGDVAAGPVDLEVVVCGVPMRHGFEGALANGQTVAVVHERSLSILTGERLRVLGGRWDPEREELVVTKHTEVFHRA